MGADIDSLINWKQFYEHFGVKLKESGGDHKPCKCPFHGDSHESMSVNIKTGQYKCHGCDESGNAYTFLQKVVNLTPEQATAEINKWAGVRKDPPPVLTLKDYAKAKKLPVEFLTGIGVHDTKKGLNIPYKDEAGNVAATRQRFRMGKEKAWAWVRGSKLRFYGLWRLKEILEAGQVILVEGESDSQTLWHHGYSALGVPGANTFKGDWFKPFLGVKDVYLFKEPIPPEAGELFVSTCCEGLSQVGFKGNVYVITSKDVKDPSALHIQNPDNFKAGWEMIMAQRQPIDLTSFTVKVEETLPGAPIQLRWPAEWRVNEKGVHKITEAGLSNVCPVPLILSRRLRNIDTGEEKIEIAYQRDGYWNRLTAQRSTVFVATKFPILADKGIPTTSERAKYMVRYLGELEAANLDVLPVVKSVERVGWITSKQFFPGCLTDDLLIDVDSSLKVIADAFHDNGSFEQWKVAYELMAARPIARFMLAASFAAPLVSIVGHRVFMVHVYGPSRAGKTAGLVGALSVWGYSDGLMTSFNSTKVGLERMASFFSDLPMGIDERQAAPNKQHGEAISYLLGLGKGRARGAKGGGLQAAQSWQNIMIMTGEEPVSSIASHTGVKTRTLEIYGIPFESEQDAREIYRITSGNYGMAGPMFVRRLIEEQKKEPGFVLTDYNAFVETLQEEFSGNMGSHVTAVALCALTDYYVSQWIGGRSEEVSFAEATDLARTILGMLETTQESDYCLRAWDFIAGWVAANSDKFSNNALPPQYGFTESVRDMVYVVPQYLEKALEDAGYAPRRVMRDLGDKGFIETGHWGDGKKRLQVRKQWKGEQRAFVGLKMALSTY